MHDRLAFEVHIHVDFRGVPWCPGVPHYLRTTFNHVMLLHSKSWYVLVCLGAGGVRLFAVESTGKSNGTCLRPKMRRRCGQWPAAQNRSKWQSPCFLEPHDLQGLGLRKVTRNGARVCQYASRITKVKVLKAHPTPSHLFQSCTSPLCTLEVSWTSQQVLSRHS